MSHSSILLCCFTSTEVRWLIRDGDRVGRGRKSEGSTVDTTRKRPERLWTAARTMEVLRRCPLAIAQRLVHCAIAVSTAVLGQSHKDNVRCTAVDPLQYGGMLLYTLQSCYIYQVCFRTVFCDNDILTRTVTRTMDYYFNRHSCWAQFL